MFGMLIVLMVGCRTTPPVDWGARVGHYTYDQAVTELGPPDRTATLSDGRIVTEWISRKRGGSGFSVGTGFYGRHTGVSVGHAVGTGRGDRVLRLTFDQDNRLQSWATNY
jgi:hypothetical protein